MPSTVIRRFAYDPAKRALSVEFVSGRRYLYREVPEEVAAQLRGAFAKGRFFNARIRDRFACAPIDGDDPFEPASQSRRSPRRSPNPRGDVDAYPG